MIRTAICDDEQKWIDIARDIADNFFRERSIKNTIETFDNAKLLLTAAEQNKPFDILILDIDIPEINGFEAAEKLKALYPDMILMFYTAYEQFVFDSFRFQPFRYIRKEYAARELGSALLDALRVIKVRSDRFIELKSADRSYSVNISEILYFETNKRKCDVYLQDGNMIKIRKTIKALFSEIGSEDFIMIHSGAAVNIKYVSCFSNYDVTLGNGTRIPVSRPRSKEVKAAVSDYWRKRI